MDEMDRLSEKEKDKWITQTMAKRSWLVEENRAMKNAREAASDERKAAMVVAGDKKTTNRMEAAFVIQGRSEECPRTEAEVDAALLKCVTPSASVAFVKRLLQVYRSPFWTGRVVKTAPDAVPVQLAACRDDSGNKLTALSKDKVDFTYATLLRNAKRLTQLTTGLTALSVEEANVAGQLPRDTRTLRTLSSE
jgi:hypothetical protein